VKRSLVALAIVAALSVVPSVASADTYTITAGVTPTDWGTLTSAANASWSTARSAETANTATSQSSTIIYSALSGGTYTIRRGLARFVLPNLPTGAVLTSWTISAASLNPSVAVYVTTCTRTGAGAPSVADYGGAGSGSLVASGTIYKAVTPMGVSLGSYSPGELWLAFRGPNDYPNVPPLLGGSDTLYGLSMSLTYTLPYDVTNLSVNPTVTVSGPISINGTVPVSLDTTALAAAIAAAMPTASAPATETTGTVAVTIEGVGSLTTGAIDAIMVLMTLAAGALGARGVVPRWMH
jgi:hypothetical protein